MKMRNVLCAVALLGALVSAQVTVDFTADVTTGTNPVEVTFTSTITGATPTAVLWWFGDGASSALSSPSHTYTAPGSYTVTLAVVDGFEVINEVKTDYIVVEGADLTPDFAVSSTAGTNPVTLDFTDISTGVTPTAWFWDFGDGASASEPNPSHTYDTPGVFDVTLSITFGTQTESITKSELITVEPAPLIANFDVSAPVGESPLSVDFSDTSTGVAPDSWLWAFGDGATSTAQHPSHTYTSPGAYSVTLKLAFGGQTTAVTKQAVDVLPADFEATFVTDVVSGVNPLTVTFFDTTEVGVMGTDVPDTWLWRFAHPEGLSLSSSLQNPTETFDTPGSYDVTLDVTYAGTTKTVRKIGAIVVEPAPLFPDFTADITTGKLPLTVQFENLTTGNEVETWQWSFLSDVELFSAEENPVITFDTPGDYLVSLEATIGGQLEAVEKQAFIHVGAERLVVDFTSDVVQGEVPVTVAFESKIQGVEPEQLSWEVKRLTEQLGDVQVKFKSSEPNPEFDFIVPGTYMATLTATYSAQVEEHVVETYLELAPYPSTLEVESVVASHGVSDDFEASESFIVSGNWAWVVAYDPANYMLKRVVGKDTLNVNSIGSWSLDDTLLMLGAPDAGSSGSVAIYDLANGWILDQFTIVGGDPAEHFGCSVALDGDLALVGADGFAYLYDVSDPTAPILQSRFKQKFDPPKRLFSEVALHGDRALLGSRDDAAFLFDISDPTSPEQLAAFYNETSTAYPQDLQLALDERIALIGSEDVTVQVLDSQTGELLAQLDHPIGIGSWGFGISLAISDRYVIIGTGRDWHDEQGGAAYFYDIDTLELAGRVAPSDGAKYDHFGWGLEVVGNTLYVGAPWHNQYEPGSGKLYRFDLPHNAVWSDVGGGSSNAAPILVGNGNLDPNSTASLSLTDAPPNAPLFFVIGQSKLPVPFAGGVMVPAPDVRLGGYSTDALGNLYLPTSVPAVIPPGTSLVIQAWVRDVDSSDGYAGSNAIRAEVLR